MLKKSIVGRLSCVFSLILCLMMASFATSGLRVSGAALVSPQRVNCATIKDEDITNTIIATIRKTYTPEQIKGRLHFTLFTKARAVEIVGDAHGINPRKVKEEKNNIIKIARQTNCVKKVVAGKFSHIHDGSCGTGQQRCNGRCISALLPCNPLMP